MILKYRNCFYLIFFGVYRFSVLPVSIAKCISYSRFKIKLAFGFLILFCCHSSLCIMHFHILNFLFWLKCISHELLSTKTTKNGTSNSWIAGYLAQSEAKFSKFVLQHKGTFSCHDQCAHRFGTPWGLQSETFRHQIKTGNRLLFGTFFIPAYQYIPVIWLFFVDHGRSNKRSKKKFNESAMLKRPSLKLKLKLSRYFPHWTMTVDEHSAHFLSWTVKNLRQKITRFPIHSVWATSWIGRRSQPTD